MNTSTKYLTISFLILFPLLTKAQKKYEGEYRIKSEIIPPAAKAFVDSIQSDSKIKWYKEIALKDITIEAKFKHKKKKYSVEFDTLGTLQDVEFVIKKSEINPEVYNKIKVALDSVYQKWKFQKIQMSYSGNNQDIQNCLRNKETCDLIRINYEIVLKGKNSEGTHLYEVTFNRQGEILHILHILQENTDHLEY